MEISEIITEPQVVYNNQTFRLKVKVIGGYNLLLTESGNPLITDNDYYLVTEGD